MTEQELKIVLQGAIDGKEIQCKWYPNGSFQKVNWDELSTPLAGLNAYHREYPFRIKPNTLEYKTRPYAYVALYGKDSIHRVWNNLSEDESEENFERYMNENTSKFKWLADATEHEVEYE